jgi:hypothetical protein
VLSPVRYGPNTASTTVRVPQQTTASSRNSGYPDPPWWPVCLPNTARFGGLSGTLIVVPSIAHTTSPRHRTGPAVVTAGPRSRSNNTRTGAAPTRRRAWVNAAVLGWATGSPSRPATRRCHTCR